MKTRLETQGVQPGFLYASELLRISPEVLPKFCQFSGRVTHTTAHVSNRRGRDKRSLRREQWPRVAMHFGNPSGIGRNRMAAQSLRQLCRHSHARSHQRVQPFTRHAEQLLHHTPEHT
jgi:hypothetical protein